MSTKRSIRAVPAVLRTQRGNPSNRPQRADADLDIATVDYADPPEHLSETARQIWNEIMLVVGPVKILSLMDLVAFELMCECYADWVDAKSHLQQVGSNYYTVTDINGNTRHLVHPAVGVANSAETRLRAWLAEFGMTPSSRARWKQPPQSIDYPDDVDLSELTPEEREFVRGVVDRKIAEDAG